MQQGFTEEDWRLFQKKLPEWQDAYMNKLNREYIELLKRKGNPSEKFWTLYDRLQKDSKKCTLSFRMSRSTMVYNILTLLNNKVINETNLQGFSEEFKKTIGLEA